MVRLRVWRRVRLRLRLRLRRRLRLRLRLRPSKSRQHTESPSMAWKVRCRESNVSWHPARVSSAWFGC